MPTTTAPEQLRDDEVGSEGVIGRVVSRSRRILGRSAVPSPESWVAIAVDLSEQTVVELLALSSVALAHDELPAALREVCVIAVRAVRHADGASMTTFGASGPSAVASSSEWAESLDELQFEEHEGPCLDAARTGALFRVRDVGAEARWPSYMPRAYERGVLSMLSLPMTVETKTIGAINVYSRQRDAFGSEEMSIAEIVAAHASLATHVAATLHGHRALAEQLREAMASRAVIEQAKGILMSTLGCDEDTAFEHLVRQSQHENVKLRAIVTELVRQQRREH
jgi:GAF domain-containing protein